MEYFSVSLFFGVTLGHFLLNDEDFAEGAKIAGIEYDTLVQAILDDALRRPAGPHSAA